MSNTLGPILHSLAKKIRNLRIGRAGKLEYHVLAAAVYWPDELPPRLSPNEEDVMRGILHYRMSLILGEPDQSLQQLWDAFTEAVPQWRGFEQSRCDANPAIIEFFEKQSAQARDAFKSLLDMRL